MNFKKHFQSLCKKDFFSNLISGVRNILFLKWLLYFFLLWPQTVMATDFVQAVTKTGTILEPSKIQHQFQQIDVQVYNLFSISHCYHRFLNDFSEDLEIRFRMPLPPGSATIGFSYWNGDERVVGEVLEKSVANRIYEKLSGIHQDPGICNKESNRDISIKIFPHEAGESKPIEVQWFSILERENGWFTYRVPIGSLPHSEAIPFSFSLTLHDDVGISEVKVSPEEAEISFLSPFDCRVSFESDLISFSNDLYVRYKPSHDADEIRFMSYKKENCDTGYFTLTVTPRYQTPAKNIIPKDIVFLADISGSMEGLPLKHLKQAFHYMIENLNAKDRFEVIAFESDTMSLFNELADVNDQNIREAMGFIDALKSGGGTNFEKPLADAFDLLTDSEVVDAIFFFTDGNGVLSPSFFTTFGKEVERVRIFTFGFGSSVNTDFLDELASEHHGYYTAILDPEFITEKIIDIYEKVSQPLMMDIHLSFTGVEPIEIVPREIPDLYLGDRLIITGCYTEIGDSELTLHGWNGEEIEIRKNLYFPSESSSISLVPYIWAKMKADALLKKWKRSNEQTLKETLKREIITLSLSYNFITPFTAFLAVPESLKTEEIKDIIREGRRDQSMTEAYDALKKITLSLKSFPPGDPVVTVRAEQDAQSVTGYFPYGIVKNFLWDPIRGCWNTRFLAPRSMEEGTYTILVRIIHEDGKIEWLSTEFRIDLTEPEFDIYSSHSAYPGDVTRIWIDPHETVKSVLLYTPWNKKQKAELDQLSGLYFIDLRIPTALKPGEYTFEIDVRDPAGNHLTEPFTINVTDPMEFFPID